MILFQLFVFLLTSSLLYSKQYTLNVPRVLLPYVPPSGIKSNFTLKSEHGCFTWKSTKPDVATVDPVYMTTRNGLKCSREAILTPQSTTPTRLSTVIIATEEATSLPLRSDVYVDTVARIEITTRTRELLLEEEPEKFEVRAFDDEGNMFSTVRGHVFEWTLLKDEDAVHQHLDPDAILSFVQFEESAYSTDIIIGELESKNLQGDEVLVAGVNTGTAKVQVRLVEPAWKSVACDIVKLLVIENLILYPTEDQYIMPHSYVDYHVERRTHGTMEIVSLPSDQYRLDVTNTTVCSLNRELSRATGLMIGDTEVILHDKNMLNIPHATKPSSDIHVVFPHRIGFSVSPGNNWVLEVNKDYVITVNLFDKNNRKIYITENVILSSSIPMMFFSVHSSSVNGSHHFVKTIQIGSTLLNSSIENLMHPDTRKLHPLPHSISKSQSVEIVEPVLIDPKIIVLLSDKKNEQIYQHQMRASGGTGRYRWSSDCIDYVGVSRVGVVNAVQPGKAVVTVSDAKNTDLFDQAKVYVVPPSSLAFVPSRVEVVVKQELLLPLQLKGFTLEDAPLEIPFYDCRYVQFKLAIADQAIFNATMSTSVDLSTLPDGACTFVKLFALKPGHTTLTVTYDHGSIHLKTFITVASYPPLQPIDPEDIAVVTVGSSKTMIFEGGPPAWVLNPSRYHKTLNPEDNPEGVSISSLPSSTLTQHTYTVVCRSVTTQSLSFTVGNGPTEKNQIPVNETITISLSCAIPVSMVIKPVVREMTDCPLLRGSSQDLQFPVHNGAPLQLELTVYDSERRKFDNFSSLQWVWSSSDRTLLDLTQEVIRKIDHYGHKAIVTAPLVQRAGSVTVTASSDTHNTRMIELAKAKVNDPFSPRLNYSLSLLLRSAPIVSPRELLVYNHPMNMATLNILHGSKHFSVDYVTKPRPPVADVNYIKESQNINIHPLGEGVVRITITDLCLPVADITVNVFVSTVHSIQLRVPDKVQVGSTILAYVRPLDSRERPFPANQHHLMKLQPNPKTDNIEVKQTSDTVVKQLSSADTSVSSVYVVEGVVMGTALLLFNATLTTGKVITSWPAEIQVFEALRLDPANITLLPTATFQIRSFGGPIHQTSIDYCIDNTTTARVDQSGLITASVPGNAIVTGKARSVEGGTDYSAGSSISGSAGNVVYSSDTVKVKVVKLTGIRIVIPSTKLVAEEEVAVYAQGLNDDETPFTFSSITPGLTFYWSVSNMDVLSLVSVYDQAGVSLQEERDFASRLRTRNPGRGVIRVTMKCPPGMCVPDEGTFTDEVNIRVFPSLKLINPANGRLLIPQNGMTIIKTNRDGSAPITYSLVQSCAQEEQPVIYLGPNGEISSNGFNGHAVVMVTANEIDLGVNQTVLVHCEVGAISSLSLSALSPAKATPHSKEHAFPLGYSATFSANLHDSIGRQFDYADIDLSYRLNRFDIVHVTKGTGNQSYIVKAAKQGNAIFKVWVSDDASISDYIRVRVGYAIIPSQATVHLGAKICFTTHLTEQRQPGKWSTSEESVLSMTEDTGVAIASGTGRTVVYHKIGGVVDTLTEISVATIKRVVFSLSPDPSSLPFFTNAPVHEDRESYQIPVEFKDEHNDTDFTELVSSLSEDCLNEDIQDSVFLQQVAFQCILELTNGHDILTASRFISTESYFDCNNGRSYCRLLPSTSDTGISESLSILSELKLVLKVKASDYNGSYNVWSRGLEIPFLPAFTVDRTEVVLTSTDITVTVRVSGLMKILNTIQPSSPYPLTVTRQSMMGTSASYLITFTNPEAPPTQSFNNTRVILLNTLTHQQLVILVSYTGITESLDSASCHTPNEGGVSPAVDKGYLNEDQWNLVFAGTACLILLLATIVVGLALRQSSQKVNDGFSSKLPPTSPPPPTPGAAFPSSTPTRSQVATPTWNNPGTAQSAFKRTPQPTPSHTSNRTSPQHNLFSQ